MKKILIVGGGAAGFFSAINIAEKHPDYRITLIEKTGQVLSKVKISGGGRCNVTNGRSHPSELVAFYPRGGKKLYPLFKRFTTSDMIQWLADRKVPVHQEDDYRIFPVSDSSQTIIDCFLDLAARHRIDVLTRCGLIGLRRDQGRWVAETSVGSMEADKVILATGSSAKIWDMVAHMGISLSPPVPSLFTFNIRDTRIADLPGITLDQVNVRITGTDFSESGPLLITHWGLSGPAILKLSAQAARELAQRKYQFSIRIHFLPGFTHDSLFTLLDDFRRRSPKKKFANVPFPLPKRFLESIGQYSGIKADQSCGDLSNKQINKLCEELTQGLYVCNGKSTFKEEFVTCGGILLSEVNLDTMELKNLPGIHCSGEMLDIDALTGGFNFQACWTTGWIISESI